MKKQTILIIIILVAVIGIGVVTWLTGQKECADMNEQECKMADNCLSVLVPVPCDTEPCTEAEFKECKDKTK